VASFLVKKTNTFINPYFRFINLNFIFPNITSGFIIKPNNRLQFFVACKNQYFL